jgi:hypothetical protein
MLKPIFWLLVLLGLLALKAKGQTDYNDVGLDCWDVCFMEASDEQESQEAVEFYYTLVEKLRFMRMYYGVNTTALLVDSSIHSKHFAEPNHGSVFSFEQALGSLIAYTTPAEETSHPVFIVQFDENQAWYCDTWGCNGRCEGSDTLMFDVEDALEADTDERGKIEDACHLAAKAIINEPCGGYDRNPMLVAITNSKFDDHVMRHHHHKDSSCKRFRHRMHIGTHFTAYEMEKDNRRKRFASTHHNHIMVKDREMPHMKTVLKNLVECMSVECCSTGRKRKKRSAPVCERTLAGYEKGFDTFTWSK